MQRISILLLFNLCIFHCLLYADNTEQLIIGKKPEWVESLNPDLKAVCDVNSLTGGFYIILLDNQIDVHSRAVFRHIAVKITGFEGIDYMSDITIEFDPEFHNVIFHRLIVHRDGLEINKLKDHQFSTFQREVNFERKQYDGWMTSILNLRDVRIGDIIEYEYTISGINPIYKDFFSSQLQLEYTIPVHRNYARIIVPDPSDLQLAYPFGEVSSEVIHHSNSKEYIWDQQKPEPLLFDNNVPYWYDPLKGVVFSDFENWGDVVSLILEYYSLPILKIEELEAEIDNVIFCENENLDQFISNSIRFVQDEIRYLGFESGINAYRPHSPIQVLNQRYGDCKDKSLLLCAILKTRGISAFPVLVNSYKAFEIEKSVPSLRSFDHVIVQIEHDGKIKYVDPSMNCQGGIWEYLYTPDYRIGLVINAGTEDLTYLPESDITSTVISESFDFEAGQGRVVYSIVTDYYGLAADIQRNILLTNSLDYLEKYYLDYYSNLYPGIKLRDNLQIIDSREIDNRVTQKESYYLEDIWTEDVNNSLLRLCNIYSPEIEYEIGILQSANRTMPYYLSHPTDINVITHLNLSKEFDVDIDKDEYYTKEFSYKSNISSSGQKIIIRKRYQTFSDFVPASGFKDYQEKVDLVLKNIHFQLTDYDSVGGAGKTSWFAVLVSIITLALGAYGAIRIYKNYDPAPRNTVEKYTRELGSWLILIGIGLFLTPFVIVGQLLFDDTYFNAYIWSGLINPDSGFYNLPLTILMLVELIYAALIFVYVVFLNFLFYKRRTSFPRLIIIYLLANALFSTIDSIVALMVSDFTEPEWKDIISGNIRSLIIAGIWVPYFIFSERVKDTFTVSIRQPLDTSSTVPDTNISESSVFEK